LSNNPGFHRLELITGPAALRRLQRTRVIVFGVGGVGSWCAEALVRSGIGMLTLVDSDMICVTNINRQVQASETSIGKAKVTELADRLRTINSHATITPLQTVFTKATADRFGLGGYEYVIDAIDSLGNKTDLIIAAHQAGAMVFTALGASNKLDPLQIKIGSLWDSQGCPLGRYVRKRLKKKGFSGEVTCVFSEENLPMHSVDTRCGKESCLCPGTGKGPDGTVAPAHEWCSSKKQINGSAVHITGTFGFYLAGMVIRDVIARAHNEIP
jgi:tRNA threonylcarbamoyladenosine dehydratase